MGLKDFCKKKLPLRFWVAVMIFMSCFVSYMIRVDINLIILEMAMPMTIGGKAVIPECVQRAMEAEGRNESEFETTSTTESSDIAITDRRFDWDNVIQGRILSSFYYGYNVANFVYGPIAERWGPRKTFVSGIGLAALFTLLTPVAAYVHWICVYVLRMIVGFFVGATFPCVHTLMARWAPPREKGKFSAALLGGGMGIILSWPLIGQITERINWIFGFVTSGTLGLAFCGLYYFIIRDYPSEHPYISSEELSYIEENMGPTLKKFKKLPPYRYIFLSIRFWSLVILHMGNLWGLYFLMTVGPKYQKEVMGFRPTKAGLATSPPLLLRMLVGLLFGIIGDYMRKNVKWRLTVQRKFFLIFSHFIPGLLISLMYFVECNIIAAIFLTSTSLGINGSDTQASLINPQDLAPNYAGTLYGMINCFGGISGLINPEMVGYITRKKSGVREWALIFLIGGIMYMSCGIIFLFFGTAETQFWNDPDEIEARKKKKKEDAAGASAET